MNNEIENICNMPTIMKIEAHQSKETGNFYIEFIDCHSENTLHTWQQKNITKEQLSTLFSILYSKGEQI